MKKILLFPFNGSSIEAASIIEDINRIKNTWEITGFIDDDPEKSKHHLGGYMVLGGQEKIHDYPDAMVLAIPGRPENFRQRASFIESLGLPAERFATIVHPSVSIGIGCSIGNNTLIMPNVVLTANVKIGNNVVILPNSVISHDSSIGDYCLIGSNTSVSGGVNIEENCYIGTGSKIIQQVTIGGESLIGLGAVVLKDVPQKSTFAGNPAKEINKQI